MAGLPKADLTAIYYTANTAPSQFRNNNLDQLKRALGDIPLITIHKPSDVPRSQIQIYRQVLQGAKQANTNYVACCEDDVLYSSEHFKFRPKDGHWGYNMNSWSIFTWGEPMFTYKAPGGRRNLNGLICERQMLIDHLEERFSKWNEDNYNIDTFGEPGKYDKHLGTTPHPSEDFYVNPPNIVFSHQTNLQFQGLGTRKALGQIRATAIPYWGTAETLRSFYE
jgi:hypothetical protein